MALGLVWVLSASGCKCGKDSGQAALEEAGKPEYASTVSRLPGASQVDVARLIPDSVDLALVADRPAKLYGWLQQRAWWQAARRSPVWADLFLSGPLVELSNARHKLASLSPVDLKPARIEDLLPTPMGLALARKPDGWRFLVIKQIDLKVQALDRLAEVFNQVRPDERLTSREVQGVTVRSLALGPERQIHYAVYSNLLLISNDGSLIDQTVALASGRPAPALVAAKDAAALWKSSESADLLVFVRPGGISRWLATLLPVEALVLGLHLEPTGQAAVEGLPLASAGPSECIHCAQALRAMTPLQSRLVISRAGLDLSALWRSVQAAAGKGQTPAKSDPLELDKKLFARLSGEAILVLTRFDLPVPRASLLLRAARTDGLEQAMIEVSTGLSGARPTQQQRPDLGGKSIWSQAGQGASLGFALQDDWLVVGTSPEAVGEILATAAGKAPALTDLPGFQDRLLAGANPFFELVFVDFQRLFEDLHAASKVLIARSERFDASDLEDTWAPLFEALAKIGKLGAGLAQRQALVGGSLIAL